MTGFEIALLSILGGGLFAAFGIIAFLVVALQSAHDYRGAEVLAHRKTVLAFDRASLATNARERVALDRSDPDTADRRAELELAARDRVRRGEGIDSLVDYDTETGDVRAPVGAQ